MVTLSLMWCVVMRTSHAVDVTLHLRHHYVVEVSWCCHWCGRSAVEDWRRVVLKWSIRIMEGGEMRKVGEELGKMNMESVGNLDWSTRENELLKFIKKTQQKKNISNLSCCKKSLKNTKSEP